MVRTAAAKASEKRRRKMRAAEAAMMGTGNHAREAAKASEKRRRKLRALENELGLAPRMLSEDSSLSHLAASVGCFGTSIRQNLETGNVDKAIEYLVSAVEEGNTVETDLLKEVALKSVQRAHLRGAETALTLMQQRQHYPNVRTMVTLLAQMSQRSGDAAQFINSLLSVVDFGFYGQPDPGALEVRQRYCQHFIPLLMMEFLDEAGQAVQRITQAPPAALEDQGLAILDVEFTRNSKPTYVEVYRKRNNEVPAPFMKGDTVLISLMHPNQPGVPAYDGAEAEVVGVVPGLALRVINTLPLQNFPGCKWRVDKMANRTSLVRQLEAIKRLVEIKDNVRQFSCAHRSIHDALLYSPLPSTPSAESVQAAQILSHQNPQHTQYALTCCTEPARSSRGGALPPARIPQDIEQHLNESQQNAVRNALTYRVSLIHGPPGTGKTYTAIALMKAWLLSGMGPILATSDSNTAVDNLVAGLAAAGARVVRIGRPEGIRPDLNKFTLENLQLQQSRDAQPNYQLQQQILRQADVVCATCSGAGCEVVEKTVFRSVLIDEASQATEPSTLIPIVHGAQQVALVGDHKQLPPTILSRAAELQGLGVSLFDRFVAAGVKPHMLDTQYRMHPGLAVYSSLHMYDGLLKSGVPPHARPPPSGFRWPSEKAPVAFISVSSFEQTEGMSYVNRQEAERVVATVESLLAQSGLKQSDIGIITPYAAQVRLIRRMLRIQSGSRGLARGRMSLPSYNHPHPEQELGLEVNSVDGFQGREKEIIIVSAVRANHNSNVGFLSDYRRMNVMLTRARRGIIIFGEPRTLSQDGACWGPWLDWAKREGYTEGFIPEAKINPPPSQSHQSSPFAAFNGPITVGGYAAHTVSPTSLAAIAAALAIGAAYSYLTCSSSSMLYHQPWGMAGRGAAGGGAAAAAPAGGGRNGWSSSSYQKFACPGAYGSNGASASMQQQELASGKGGKGLKGGKGGWFDGSAAPVQNGHGWNGFQVQQQPASTQAGPRFGFPQQQQQLFQSFQQQQQQQQQQQAQQRAAFFQQPGVMLDMYQQQQQQQQQGGW